MKIIVAIVFGFLSGFLIYMGSAMLFMTGEPSSLFILITFIGGIGGWVISSWIVVRKTKTLSRVFSRGFLLGAAEWLAIIPIGLVFSGRMISQALLQGDASNAAIAGATVGAGLFSIMTGGVAVAMAVVCLIGFAVAHFLGREMKAETAPATRRCPECAEFIQTAAVKCKHCSDEIKQAKKL